MEEIEEIEEVTEDYEIELEDTEEDDTDQYIACNLNEMARVINEIMSMPTNTIEECKSKYEAIVNQINNSDFEYYEDCNNNLNNYYELLNTLIKQNNKDTLSLIYKSQEYYKQW